jgi:hypothetical protein
VQPKTVSVEGERPIQVGDSERDDVDSCFYLASPLWVDACAEPGDGAGYRALERVVDVVAESTVIEPGDLMQVGSFGPEDSTVTPLPVCT